MSGPGRRRAAVLGHPIAHSLSPLLHAAAYEHLGLDWDYQAIDVTAAELPEFVRGLGSEWVGLSLTMPLKEAVLPLLEVVEETAATVGAANTVIFGGDGQTRSGHNTDVGGMLAALDERELDPVEEATILGGGATARSALLALARRGTRRVQAYVRRPEAQSALVDLASKLEVELMVAPWIDAPQGLLAPLVVSAVPSGAPDALVHAVPTMAGTLFDVVYDPWPTPLAERWTVRSGTVISGFDLLVHQAAMQVELMCGQAVPVDVLRAALPRGV